jgi:23S rRNA pseudouridine2605 synthase
VPDDVKLQKRNPETSVFRIILHEGRKREIRRIFDAAGFRVKTLRRTAFGGLTLGRLGPGQWRRLKREEVRKLKAVVGLEPVKGELNQKSKFKNQK